MESLRCYYELCKEKTRQTNQLKLNALCRNEGKQTTYQQAGEQVQHESWTAGEKGRSV
jgi:hypothetical protein